MRKHYCNTENPTRSCCWSARAAEFDALERAEQARVAKYGRIRCPRCGRVYAVRDGVVEDHEAVCRPLTDAQVWS